MADLCSRLHKSAFIAELNLFSSAIPAALKCLRNGECVKNNADAPFFTQLFVSERKQTTLMADEKSPARISHRRFATKSLRNEE